MNTFFQLLKTEFRRIFSNGVLVAIFFGAPILYGILFGYVYRQSKVVDLPIAVVDYDRTATSDKLIEALNDNESVQVVAVLPDAVNLAQQMPARQYQAVVTIPDNFERAILQKRYPEVQVDINMANILNANFASRGIQTVMGTINAGIEIEAIKKTGVAPTLAQERFESFKVTYNRLYNSGSSYMEFMWPGLLGAIMQQVFFLGLALGFARDFEDGYFNKLVQHNRRALYHMALKSIPFVLLGAAMWVAVGYLFPLFGIHLPFFTAPMALLIALFSLACIAIGMLFSIAIPSQLKATELLMVISTPSFVISGFTWPLHAMPTVVQYLAQAIPLTHYLEGFRRLSVYGGSLADVQPQLAALAWSTLICLVAMSVLLQWKIKKTPLMVAAAQKGF